MTAGGATGKLPVLMKTLVWLPRIFAAIGLAMLLVSSWIWTRERNFEAGATRVTGTVVDMRYERDTDGGGHYFPIVAFVTARGDSVSFRSRVGTSPPSHQVGETVTVLYDPANVQDASLSGFFSLYIGAFITGLFALIFGGIGGIWIYVQRRAAAIAEELRRTGRRIEATFSSVELRTNLKVNNRSPWRIVCQWQDPATQEVQVYRSGNIWFDPTEYVKETVPVFVDRNNPQRYHVDLSFLPPAGN